MFRVFYSVLRDQDLIRMAQKPTTRVYSKYEPKANNIISALKSGNYNLVRTLAKTADINGHNRGENTPLTDAAERGDNKAIRFLIQEMKADLHTSCDCPYNQTALHYASSCGHLETAKLLISLGADPNALDSRGKTPIDLAKNSQIQGLLRDHGCLSGMNIPKHRVILPRKGSCQSIGSK
jgi:ankyrin repeat protein